MQDALAALGGIGRVPGSCARHILGLGWSLNRWAVELGRDRHIAAGILIATLAS